MSVYKTALIDLTNHDENLSNATAKSNSCDHNIRQMGRTRTGTSHNAYTDTEGAHQLTFNLSCPSTDPFRRFHGTPSHAKLHALVDEGLVSTSAAHKQ